MVRGCNLLWHGYTMRGPQRTRHKSITMLPLVSPLPLRRTVHNLDELATDSFPKILVSYLASEIYTSIYNP